MQQYFYDKLMLIHKYLLNYQTTPLLSIDRVHKIDLTLAANYNFYIALRDNIAEDALNNLSVDAIISMHFKAQESDVELIPHNLIISHYLYSLKPVDDDIKDRIRKIFGTNFKP